MQDHAKPIRQRLIQATPPLTDIDIKRERAIAYLGENWMLHPHYNFRQRHAFSVTRWQPCSLLRPIQIAAQQAQRI